MHGLTCCVPNWRDIVDDLKKKVFRLREGWQEGDHTAFLMILKKQRSLL
jgi:hypothetical protein